MPSQSCAGLSLKGAPLQVTSARRQEAALTSGSLAWNRMPTTFQRARSAKLQRSQEMAAAFGPRSPRSQHGPELHLQPLGAEGRAPNPVISLSHESGSVRPKTANFPARNFLSGYRQMPPSRGSAREQMDSGATSRSSFLLGMGNPSGGAQPDLDQMNEEELKAIFEELARSGEEEEQRERAKKQSKAKKSKAAGFVHPAATELLVPPETPHATTKSPDTAGSEFPGSCQDRAAGRTTPTFLRLRPQSRTTHSAKSIGSGKILQSEDNMLYVPKLKTRYCRVYVGSNVARSRQDGEEYEFLPMNQRAPLHNPQEKHQRRGFTCHSRPPPVVYSSNFFTPYDHGGQDIYEHHTPEADMECIMCQHLLNQHS